MSSQDLEAIEALLLYADIGISTVEQILNEIEKTGSKDLIKTTRSILIGKLPKNFTPFSRLPSKTVILIVGVNGTGKTTTAAKLAGYYQDQKKDVLLIGGDTYRTAAVQQLKEWSERLNIRFIYNEKTKDPSSVLYDGMKAARTSNVDMVIVDTAGRLHTYKNLMKELEKMNRVLINHYPDYHVIKIITIDAVLGQNSMIQAKEFSNYIKLDAAILTKMDGSAKGGIIIPLFQEQNLPVWFIGTGEGLDDLVPFNSDDYVDALLGSEFQSSE
jgi:fused signal recognition particle receptor